MKISCEIQVIINPFLKYATSTTKYKTCYFRSTLVNLFDYDKFLAATLEGGNNPQALNFAMFLAKVYLIDDRSNAQLIESDLFGTLEVSNSFPVWLGNRLISELDL